MLQGQMPPARNKIVKSERVGRIVVNTIKRDFRDRPVFEARTTGGTLLASGLQRAAVIRHALEVIPAL